MAKANLPVRRGIVAVVFKRVGRAKRFLLLHRVLNWTGWEFPKGGLRKNEPAPHCMFRELAEETGITKDDIACAEPLRKHLRFIGSSGRKRDLNCFLVEVRPKTKAKLPAARFPEHDKLEWASAAVTRRKLEWDAARKMFEEALKCV